MNKKILLLVIIIILAIGIYFLLSSSKNKISVSDSSVDRSTTEKTVVVSMNENGFSPPSINIKQGETVVFKNNGIRDHWPASAIHPTHSVYSGTSLSEHCPDTTNIAFDACKGILPGNSWSFTFTKKGSWRYHDHLNPTFTGTINVE